MGRFLAFFALALLLPGSLPAQMPSVAGDWQKIREKQPTVLHLTMTFAKDHFFQGERINAHLEFSNDDEAHPYGLQVGAEHDGAYFRALDDLGKRSSIRWDGAIT